MAKKPSRKALGRGLSALLGDAGSDVAAATQPETADAAAAPAPRAADKVPIDLIQANPNQPRKHFRDEDLHDLAASLKVHGLIQPVLLRPHPETEGAYQIVAGERRWRAAQIAGLHELPAVIRELDDREILELGIIENVQRVDLDPVEEALGYNQLIETFGYTQEELSRAIGKSRSHLSNTVRLLVLPEQVLDLLSEGKLSSGHARALVKAKSPVSLAVRAAAEGLSVRQLEKLVRKEETQDDKAPTAKAEKDADTKVLEGDLSAAIGMKVQIEHGAEGRGEVRIRYRSLDQLDQLCQRLAE